MKVALVCPYDWAKPGGVRAHVQHLADYLAEDHEVRIFAPSSEPVHDRRVTVVGRPFPIAYNRSQVPLALSPIAARRVVTVLREFAPHVTHVHEPVAPLLSPAAAAFGPRPILGTFHAWSDQAWLYRAVSPVMRRVARRLDARVAVSPAAQQFAGESLGLPLGAFRVLPNGVDTDLFTQAEPIGDLVDPRRPLLLFVGRLEPRKGLDVLIRAFLRLRAARPGLRLCIVGDGPERDRCQQMVPASIRPDVLFVGYVEDRQKARYHASADVYVAPNTGGESFGIVLLEAMAAGLPVVASDIPGFRSVMKDGREGRFVPPGNALALADALSALLANERLRGAMAVEGRRTAEAYDWAIVGGQLVDLYRQLVRGQ